jgi:hypothetical protein
MVKVSNAEGERQQVETVESRTPIGTEMPFSTSPLDAEIVFVDGMRDVIVLDGAARLSFFQARLDSKSGGPVGVHTLSLAMTTVSLKKFYNNLSALMDDMTKKGHL